MRFLHFGLIQAWQLNDRPTIGLGSANRFAMALGTRNFKTQRPKNRSDGSFSRYIHMALPAVEFLVLLWKVLNLMSLMIEGHVARPLIGIVVEFWMSGCQTLELLLMASLTTHVIHRFHVELATMMLPVACTATGTTWRALLIKGFSVLELAGGNQARLSCLLERDQV